MRYAYDFTIPANTLASAPYQDRARLGVGTLTQVVVRFPSGCNYQVTFAIRDGLLQIVPATEGRPIKGNNYIFFIPMQYALTYKPYDLILEGTSPGCNFDHTLNVWIDVTEPEPQTKADIQALIDHLNSEV